MSHDAREPGIRSTLVHHAGLVLVLGLTAVWFVTAWRSPDTMRWLRVDPVIRIPEGPFELGEHLVLAFCLVPWLVVLRRVWSDRLQRWLAIAMLVQLVVILGEEIDWGQELGLPVPRAVSFHRNIRMYLRYLGLPQPLEQLAPMTYLLGFLFWPLVPLATVRRAWERVRPVRTELRDALAVLVVLPVWLLISLPLGALQPMEFVQMAGYLVVAVISLRVLHATAPPRAPAPEPPG